jgi:trehalose 6-phosphate phosphatase
MCTAVSTLNDMDAFFDELRRARKRALLLDYDGTLAPFQANRNAALPYVGVAELLVSIIMGSTQTRVVLITGRPARELRSLLPFVPAPEIWGSHGLERLGPDGSYQVAGVPRGASNLLALIDRRLQAEGLEEHMERKAGAIAVHWRGLDSAAREDIRERVNRVWSGARAQSLIFLTPFDGGLEFRVGARNKGDAVRHILAELDSATPVAYLGDDYTDEDAFKALENRGLSVLVRNEFRPTAADIWIQPPQGLLDFLAEWLQACDAGMGSDKR